jgi:hypothetical protein
MFRYHGVTKYMKATYNFSSQYMRFYGERVIPTRNFALLSTLKLSGVVSPRGKQPLFVIFFCGSSFWEHMVRRTFRQTKRLTKVWLLYMWTVLSPVTWHPCGSGLEYLHRDPASHRRRRKGKSQIWDSKIWSRVPRNSGPRKTRLARVSSIYKKETCPLVREGAPQEQDRNCQRVLNGARHQDLLIDCPSVAMWLSLWLWQ